MNFYIIKTENYNRLLSNMGFSIFEEEVSSSPLSMFSPFNKQAGTGKYHLLFKTDVTEKMVGISDNDINNYYIPWELVGQKLYNDNEYFVFQGWGDIESGGFHQFENVAIGIDKLFFEKLIKGMIASHPSSFPIEKMKKVIGFEKIYF